MTAKMVFASATQVINTDSGIGNGAMAGGQTILDNSSNLYPYATATLRILGTFASAPTAGSTIDLYMVRKGSGLASGGTADDSEAPSGTNTRYAEYVGSFLVYALDEEQTRSITISLNGVKKAYFYIQNNSGVAISGAGSPYGATLVDIQPFSYQDA